MADETRLSFFDVLLAVVQGGLIVLKLAGQLDWSWWLVMSPLLGLVGVLLAAVLLGVLGIGTARSGGHVLAFFRRRGRLRKMYEEDPEVRPRAEPAPEESQWWRE